MLPLYVAPLVYVNMQDNYVNMQLIYVNMQDNYVNMQDIYVNMQLIYVNMQYNYSLRKKSFRSQTQQAGNRQILEARKKLHKPEHFFGKAWAVCMVA